MAIKHIIVLFVETPRKFITEKKIESSLKRSCMVRKNFRDTIHPDWPAHMNSPFDYIHAWSELARLERVDFVINYITNTAKLYIVTLHNVLPKNLPKIIHPQLQRLKILILKLLKFMSKFILFFCKVNLY
jgi:hypothetical protein